MATAQPVNQYDEWSMNDDSGAAKRRAFGPNGYHPIWLVHLHSRKGRSVSEIADSFDVNEGTVLKAIRKYRLDPPSMERKAVAPL